MNRGKLNSEIPEKEDKPQTFSISNPNPDEKSGFTIKYNSDEWRFVEFYIKSSVNQEIQIEKIFSLNNQHMAINFERRAVGKLTAHAWYIPKDKEEKNDNELAKLRKGFEQNDEGYEFLVGKQNILDDKDKDEDKEWCYVLSKIIIGDSICKIDDSSIDTKAEEYDSITLIKDKKPKNSYRITNSLNVLPMFCVYFSLLREELEVKYACNECPQDAECYCNNCEAYLCNPCYSKVHSSVNSEQTLDKYKKIFETHTKEDLPKGKLKPGKCANDQKDAEFYCQECRQSICSYCRIVGSHSKGQATRHQLKNITSIYNHMQPERLHELDRAEEFKKELIKKMGKLSAKIKDIKEKTLEEAKKQVNDYFDEELKHIKKKVNESMTSLYSILNELVVVKDMMNWLHSYFLERETFISQNSNNAELIWVKTHHGKMIQEVINNKNYINTDYSCNPEEDFILKRSNELVIKPQAEGEKKLRFEESVMQKPNLSSQLIEIFQAKLNQSRIQSSVKDEIRSNMSESASATYK